MTRTKTLRSVGTDLSATKSVPPAEQHGVTASMSRVGNCYDNAVVESFWGKLKAEMVYHEHFATKAQARAAVFE